MGPELWLRWVRQSDAEAGDQGEWPGESGCQRRYSQPSPQPRLRRQRQYVEWWVVGVRSREPAHPGWFGRVIVRLRSGQPAGVYEFVGDGDGALLRSGRAEDGVVYHYGIFVNADSGQHEAV